MNVHGHNIPFFCFLFQLFLESYIVIAAGHRVNVSIALQLSVFLLADIRETENSFVQYMIRRKIDRLHAAIGYLAVPNRTEVMHIHLALCKMLTQILYRTDPHHFLSVFRHHSARNIS